MNSIQSVRFGEKPPIPPKSKSASSKGRNWLAGGLLGLAVLGGASGYHFRTEIRNTAKLAYDTLTLTVEYKTPITAQGAIEKDSFVANPSPNDNQWRLKAADGKTYMLVGDTKNGGSTADVNKQIAALGGEGAKLQIDGYKISTKLNGEHDIIYVQKLKKLQ